MIYRHWPSYPNIDPDYIACDIVQHSTAVSTKHMPCAPNIVAFTLCLLFMNKRHLMLHIPAAESHSASARVTHSFYSDEKKRASFFYLLPFLFPRLLSHIRRTTQPTLYFFARTTHSVHRQLLHKNRSVPEQLKLLDRALH